MDDSVSTITDPTDSSFTSPSATPVLTTRSGRKRKIIQYDDGSDFMQTPVKRAKPKGRPKGSARKTPAAQELDENSLFGKLKRGQNVASIVEEWIAEYERNADNAAVQLLQFFVNSCGSQGQITSIMIQSMDFKVIINRLVDEYDDEATGDYPLVMTGSQWKKFRASFGDFIIILVNKCRSSIIFDSNLMDALIQLLTGLADNNLRAFRHTATFA
ncbi:Cohesin subunit SA-1, partial [Aphelenchoides avenae]